MGGDEIRQAAFFVSDDGAETPDKLHERALTVAYQSYPAHHGWFCRAALSGYGVPRV